MDGIVRQTDRQTRKGDAIQRADRENLVKTKKRQAKEEAKRQVKHNKDRLNVAGRKKEQKQRKGLR